MANEDRPSSRRRRRRRRRRLKSPSLRGTGDLILLRV